MADEELKEEAKAEEKVDEHARAAGDHAHGSDDHAHGSAPSADFGEVIPEKNWQDSFLALVAALVLCAFLGLGVTWSGIEPPPESETHKVEPIEPTAAPGPASAPAAAPIAPAK